MSKWISIKDKKPKRGVFVLCYSEGIEDFEFDIGRLDKDGKWEMLGWEYPVTHWMRLPKHPTE